MFDISDALPEFLWPANWTWWWIMFLPCMGFAVMLWSIGITGSGWLICVIMALFAVLTYEFGTDFWKVLMRAGMVLTTVALVVMVGAAMLMARGAPDPSAAALTLSRMNALAFVPFLISGFIMAALGGILALSRSDP